MQYRIPSETHLKIKSRKTSLIHNIHVDNPIVLCVKFQNVWTTETDVMDERDFARYEFKITFGRISLIAQHHSCISVWPLPLGLTGLPTYIFLHILSINISEYVSDHDVVALHVKRAHKHLHDI